MITLVLEVTNKNVPWQGFYNPAIPECKKGCRSIKTFKTTAKKIVKFAETQDWIDQFRVKIYEGKYESYKECKLIGELSINKLNELIKQ